MERLRYGEGLGEIGAAELAFTRGEIAHLATLLGHEADFDAGPLWADWRMAGCSPRRSQHALSRGQCARRDGGDRARARTPLRLHREEVLDQLDSPLADFVLRATTCDWLGRRLAVELHGRPDGGMLLEACLRDGLLSEEHELHAGESTYRWHPLFAAQCRRILERRDPLLAERLHRRGGALFPGQRRVRMRDPCPAGRCAKAAVASLGEHWLQFLLCSGAQALEQVCRDMPAPWGEDPEILMVTFRLPGP